MRNWKRVADYTTGHVQTETWPDERQIADVGDAERLAEIRRLSAELGAIESRLTNLRNALHQDAHTVAADVALDQTITAQSRNPAAPDADRLLRRYVASR